MLLWVWCLFQVYVYLTDINDNPPVFTQPDYAGRIHESDPTGTPIVTVIANDPDDGANGRITYHIISGNPIGRWKVELYTQILLQMLVLTVWSLHAEIDCLLVTFSDYPKMISV